MAYRSLRAAILAASAVVAPSVFPCALPQTRTIARTGVALSSSCGGSEQPPDARGAIDPVLSHLAGSPVPITNTDQARGGVQLDLVGSVEVEEARGSLSATGHPITRVESPNADLEEFLSGLHAAARAGDATVMLDLAHELVDILDGTTRGSIYDGFAMLNANRGPWLPDQVPGEYKMKRLRDSGGRFTGMDGLEHRIWELDVRMLWYDGNFDADTFLMLVPVEADEFDVVHVHYTIYSLVREDFAPTAVMLDHRASTGSRIFGRRNSVQFPFQGFDAVWQAVRPDTVTRLTVALPPVRHQRGVYSWGWRQHPPRVQFLQPIFEIVNAHTGAVELDPQSRSYAFHNRALSIDGIGEAAPEKKIWHVCQAVLSGAGPAMVLGMLEDSDTFPLGRWQDWTDQLLHQDRLPPEAWDLLAQEGLRPGTFGPYRFVSVYLNNEMYGEGPLGTRIQGWHQGDTLRVKLINLDAHTHYFRNVDFGARLTEDIAREGAAGSASHSFETMNFKPTYGAPKVAEMQWRAGWGFRPHFDVIQQASVFSRIEDRRLLQPFTDGTGALRMGWQYSAAARAGDFRFNPPRFIIGDVGAESPFPLREADGTDGLVIGQHTEGYGNAKMCTHAEHPYPGFCTTDISAFNPHGALNIDTDGDGVNDVLWFPPFLRNPSPSGGDIIPPTSAWRPFLWLNPANGTLFNDPDDPAQGFWIDRTFAHGAPIPAGGSLSARIEAPRASGQVFYQFDDLFHDNAIFSPHPTF